MTYTYTWANPEETYLKREEDGSEIVSYFPTTVGFEQYDEFLASGATAALYVAPTEPPPLTTEQKIAAAGFDEGELTEYLVAKIQLRLNE